MRVIKKIEEGRRIECPHCKSLLEYDIEEDSFMTKVGRSIECPQCNTDILVERCDPTKFPDTFYRFGVDAKAVHITDEKINEWIQKGLHFLKNHRDNDYYYTGTGDSMLCIFRCNDGDGEKDYYYCIVGQGYWESNIEDDWVD